MIRIIFAAACTILSVYSLTPAQADNSCSRQLNSARYKTPGTIHIDNGPSINFIAINEALPDVYAQYEGRTLTIPIDSISSLDFVDVKQGGRGNCCVGGGSTIRVHLKNGNTAEVQLSKTWSGNRIFFWKDPLLGDISCGLYYFESHAVRKPAINSIDLVPDAKKN